MYRWVLLLHLLAATIWLGGHLLLSLRYLPKALRLRDPEIIRGFEQQYEPLGIPALLVQVLSGLWMAFVHYRHPFISFENGMTRVVSLKLLLLLCIAVLAVHARFYLIPRLTTRRLKAMAWHIILVTIISIAMAVLGLWYRFGGI